MSPGEYLRTAFDGPDREYAHGEIVERNFGGRPHSRVQSRLCSLLGELSRDCPVEAYPSLRLRLAADLYRIPDVCLFHGAQSGETFPSQPPLLAVEVLAPADSYAAVAQKLEEYRRFGVIHIWLADPATHSLALYNGSGLRKVESLSLPECGLTVDAHTLFGETPSPASGR